MHHTSAAARTANLANFSLRLGAFKESLTTAVRGRTDEGSKLFGQVTAPLVVHQLGTFEEDAKNLLVRSMRCDSHESVASDECAVTTLLATQVKGFAHKVTGIAERLESGACSVLPKTPRAAIRKTFEELSCANTALQAAFYEQPAPQGI